MFSLILHIKCCYCFDLCRISQKIISWSKNYYFKILYKLRNSIINSISSYFYVYQINRLLSLTHTSLFLIEVMNKCDRWLSLIFYGIKSLIKILDYSTRLQNWKAIPEQISMHMLTIEKLGLNSFWKIY